MPMLASLPPVRVSRIIFWLKSTYLIVRPLATWKVMGALFVSAGEITLYRRLFVIVSPSTFPELQIKSTKIPI
jgi:hypothetical protein